MMGHLTRKTPDKKISDLIKTGKLKTADEISQPPKKQEVENIEAFNEFNKRNPKADGGRIGFAKAMSVQKKSEASYKAYEEICGLDVSPYERDLSKITELFEKKVLTLLSEHGIV